MTDGGFPDGSVPDDLEDKIDDDPFAGLVTELEGDGDDEMTDGKVTR